MWRWQSVFASSKKHFCSPDTNLFPKHMFPCLAIMKTMLNSSQCFWSKRTTMADGEANFPFVYGRCHLKRSMPFLMTVSWEMASTVSNGNDRLRKGNWRRRSRSRRARQAGHRKENGNKETNWKRITDYLVWGQSLFVECSWLTLD